MAFFKDNEKAQLESKTIWNKKPDIAPDDFRYKSDLSEEKFNKV